ncbi:hypothetical protein [Borreliella bavariensis]|uniref:hypothetical protein n=1 Tax=Borreliella bavariensis TaxID=664662 RepID=UPI001F37D683|nr:hypothetical protein [Borreliella bavariensis]
MNPTDQKNIDTKKGTNTTLRIKEENSRITVKDCINNQELFKVKSNRRYAFKSHASRH